MSRRRVAITAVPSDRQARVTTVERLADLLDTLERFGPEPEGIVVNVDAAALDELPPAWTCERVGSGNGGADVIAGP